MNILKVTPLPWKYENYHQLPPTILDANGERVPALDKEWAEFIINAVNAQHANTGFEEWFKKKFGRDFSDMQEAHFTAKSIHEVWLASNNGRRELAIKILNECGIDSDDSYEDTVNAIRKKLEAELNTKE